jgi:hypothetical protein
MGVPNSWMVHKEKSHCLMDDLGVPSFQETFILGPGLHDHPSGVRFFGQTPVTMLKVQTRMGCTKRQDGELACPFPLSRVQPGISRCISKVSTILSLCILSWNPTLRRKSCSPLLGEGLRLRSCLVVGPITVGNHHSKYILGKSGTTKIHKAVVYHSGLCSTKLWCKSHFHFGNCFWFLDVFGQQ